MAAKIAAIGLAPLRCHLIGWRNCAIYVNCGRNCVGLLVAAKSLQWFPAINAFIGIKTLAALVSLRLAQHLQLIVLLLTMADFSSFLFQNDETVCPNLGEGISRPRPQDQVKPYRILVKIPGSLPMKTTLNAPSPSEALRYASNRWPTAAWELLDD